MPDQSAYAASMRLSHSTRVYLSDMSGDAVLVGAISTTPSYPALNLAYTTSSGASSGVVRGMRVVVRTSGGDYKGTLTVRFAGTISSTNLPVREFSEGQTAVESGDAFTVYADYPIVDKLVADDGTYAPDQEAYTDQTSNPPPLTCSGGWWAGWLRQTPITFSGLDVYTPDPDSGAGVSHLYATSAGTLSSTSFSSPDLTVSAAGKIRVSHTETDNANSKPSTQQVLIRVHDENDPPYDVLNVDLEVDPIMGVTAAFEVGTGVTLDDIPDYAPVCLWCEETIGGVTQSVGSKITGRSHILCSGYLRRDRSSESGETGLETLRFEVMSPVQRLFELPGFSKSLTRVDSPDAWSEIKGLTIKRALVHLIRNYTTLTTAHDLVFVNFVDADWIGFDLQKTTPGGMIDELCSARQARLTADANGRLEIQGMLQYVALASRSAYDTTYTYTSDDVLDHQVSREHYRPVETYRMSGFVAGTTIATTPPIWARYPQSPAQGAQSPRVEHGIFDSVAALFACTALGGAWENGDYFDADGVYQRAPDVEMTLPGGYRGLFQNYAEWHAFSGMTNARGVDLSTFLFLVQRASISIREGVETTQVTLKAATHAPVSAAVDDTPEAETGVPYDPPIYDPPPTNPPTYDLGSGLSALPVDLAALSTNGNLYLITNGSRLRSGGTPTATAYNLSLTGTPRDFVVRADSPLYLGTGDTVNAHIVTDTRYYSIADLAGARTLSNTLTLEASGSYKQMQFERGDPLWGIIVYYVNSVGVRVRYTTDGGASWSSAITVSANYETTGTSNADVGLWLDPAGSGTAYVVAYTNTASGTSLNTGLYKTANYGASWTNVSEFGFVGSDLTSYALVAGTSDTSQMYYSAFNVGIAGGGARLYRNSTDITPGGAGVYYLPVYQRGISVADDDANTVVIAVTTRTDIPGTRKVFRTFNGRASAPTWVELTNTNIANARRVYAVNRTTYYLIGVSGYLAYTSDGSTVNEGAISGAGELVGLCGV